ncbi:proteasomal ubiquitin receptor ADRM1 isoform X1 [Orussus abietinus]|uniref:proteasomal ubiquitin receptor ADRM1 isoform X1 n=1 Tax=Orussus abietinus TaxID=222816 RepID=UPI0006267B55|nr:proteasomal ubiquitin receptor ADRM1 isoform X1 [Orussus abietinus]
MSSGALFGNSTVRGASKNLVEFKAGKMTMKEQMVYPDTRKGLLYVYQSDDTLMHFCWKDRTSGVVEDDLIIFPDDCEFKHVPQCKSGRVYLLRFKSSSRKFFFWLQDLNTSKDEEQCRKINEVLNNPPTPGLQRSGSANPDGDLQNLLNNMSQQQLMQLFGGVGQIGGLGSLLGAMNRYNVQSNRAYTPSSSTPVTTSVARPPAAQTPVPSSVPVSESSKSSGASKSVSRTAALSTAVTNASPSTPIQLRDLQSYLSGISTPAGAEPIAQRGVATELTKSIPPAIATTESLERAMSVHLPPGDSLCTTLSSPQFSQALSMFWSALQSGQAGPVVRQFGLDPNAVRAAVRGNLEEFVTALESEAKAAQGQSQSEDQRPAEGQQSKEEAAERKPPPQGGAPTEKKDDDDEGMYLD